VADEVEDPPRSEFPPPLEGDEGDEGARRRRLERLLGGIIRRGLEKGLGTISKTDEALRDLVGDNVKLPREIVGYFFSQVDETKNALVRVVAREVREFLEATDVASELQKALTSLSFEIKTEIRFIPNEAGDGVKPDVKARVAPRRARRRGSVPPPPIETDETDESE
jgi:hypothetical protein